MSSGVLGVAQVINVKLYRKDGYLPEIFDHIVCVITELNQNDNFRKEGKNIYERYIYQLFRSLKDHEVTTSINVL